MSQEDPSKQSNSDGDQTASAAAAAVASSEDGNNTPNSGNNNGNNNGDNHNKKQKSIDAIVRQDVGQATVAFSDLVNNNLITARYVAMGTIGLLTAYGLSQTPLFFRYRTVADIPSSWFQNRRTLRGRLIRSDHLRQVTSSSTSSSSSQPIRCYVRHLSPMERLLSKTWFDRLLKLHPAAFVRAPEDNTKELLAVEIAGIQSVYYNSSNGNADRPGEWLDALARNHTTVSLQLLGRKVEENGSSSNHKSNNNSQSSTSSSSSWTPERKKRQIPELEDASVETSLSSSSPITKSKKGGTADEPMIAVARMYYRPKAFDLFSTDVAQSMVRFGRAQVVIADSGGMYGSSSSLSSSTTVRRLVDTTESIKDLQADVKYMEQLSRAEKEAAKESRGMWADAAIRQERSDIIEEVEFQTKAPFWKKLWRRLRG